LYSQDLQEKIFVVHDGIERPEVQRNPTHSGDPSRSRRLKAVLIIGSAPLELPIIGKVPSFLDVTVVGRYPSNNSFVQRVRDSYWEMRKRNTAEERYRFARHLVKPEFQTLSWDISTAYNAMAKADIGIIPVDTTASRLPGEQVSYWQVKSENRLTMKMAVGLPVVASPVPSYQPVIQQGINGYLADDRAEWIHYLEQLRDPRLRQSIGLEARRSVLHRFSKEEQARKLLAVLHKVLLGDVSGPTGRVKCSTFSE
jgi:glycosyltransferase involved in cell wall biosynthesis